MDGEGGRSFLFESLSVGLLGAATVAIWLLMVDLVNGTPLQTPRILGSAVFFLVGVGTTLLVRRADRTPRILALFVPLTVALQALFVGGGWPSSHSSCSEPSHGGPFSAGTSWLPF